jgi:hypothetical protein
VYVPEACMYYRDVLSPGPDYAGNGYVYSCRVTRRIAQQVHVGATQLLRHGQAWHTSVVL